MTNAIKDHLHEALQRGYVAAYRFLGNRADSQEACQEAALKALAAQSKYDPSKPFYPWFYRILKNHCLDRLRQRGKQVASSSMEVVEPGASAEAQLVGHEEQEAVLRVMESLSAGHKEILELRHFQDLGYEEMAEVLGCPTGTVMSRLYRARKALRSALLQDPTFRVAGEAPQDAHQGGNNA